MKKQYLRFQQAPLLALIFSMIFGFGMPVAALASHNSSNTVTQTMSGTLDSQSLMIESGERAYVSGTASGITKLRVEITATSTDKVLAKSGTVKVRDGVWESRINKKLKDGSYTVRVYELNDGNRTQLAEGTFVVGIPPVTLKVAPLALLAGGVAHTGGTIPISYLQIVNQSDATTTINGFWVAQSNMNLDGAVIGFSSVDDKGGSRAAIGGSEGSGVLKNGAAYVPSGAVIAPGKMKLFTLKAQLSAYAASRYAGQSLMLDVTGVDAAAGFSTSLPIRGTTWVIAK